MGEVNNFITDLLDEFPLRYAEKLSLAVGRSPIYEASGRFSMSSMEKTDKDELQEDLAALGIQLNGQYFLQYETATGETMVFRFSPVITDDDFKGMIIKLINNPSVELTLALQKTNPIGRFHFHLLGVTSS